MNNDQFRRLLLANAAGDGAGKNGRPAVPTKAAALHALGSRQKASMPMTPRSVAGSNHADFAAQLAERNSEARPAKKARTSAPKGSRLGGGYVDRARERTTAEEDERAVRLKAIEEAFKKGEIDEATYDRVRSDIAGGDLSSTHLVKGLDLKLLRRVKRGEDVFSGEKAGGGEEDMPGPEVPAAVDDEFEELEQAEVQAIAKDKVQKKGQLATTASAPGQKRSRDQILAELKAAREAAKAKKESMLGAHFKKIGQRQKPGTRIERDSRGREVMIIVNEDGLEKRKFRRVDPRREREREKEQAAFVPDKEAEVLGMEVPEFYRKQQGDKEQEDEDGDINIFGDAGSDYDPLAGLEDGSEEDSASDEDGHTEAAGDASARRPEADTLQPASTDSAIESMPPPPAPPPPPAQAVPLEPRNYFKGSHSALPSAESRQAASFADPAVLAALRKAKALNAASKSEAEDKEAESQARLQRMLQDSNRDDADLDMGFGTSRLEDEAEQDETKIKLSAWGDADDGDGTGGGGGKAKRKRGPKKNKKGDVNNVADVLQAMARRKADGS